MKPKWNSKTFVFLTVGVLGILAAGLVFRVIASARTAWRRDSEVTALTLLEGAAKISLAEELPCPHSWERVAGVQGYGDTRNTQLAAVFEFISVDWDAYCDELSRSRSENRPPRIDRRLLRLEARP